MPKISYDDYVAILLDPNSADDLIAEHSRVVKGRGAFDWQLQPDPEKVEIGIEELKSENALSIGNGLARFRRARRFARRVASGESLPVLVTEGDSWFQFPLLIREVVDHLDANYLIYSVDAAGDTARNMLLQGEYLSALELNSGRVEAFLLSAAGNDIIGEDPNTGEAALEKIVRPFNGEPSDTHGHIDESVLSGRLNLLRSIYRTVVDTIRRDPRFSKLPIVLHGYDYAFPYPAGPEDNRNPIYASKDAWLGKVMASRNIPANTELGRNIIKVLIDELYAMLHDIAGDSNVTGIWVVDCRGTLPSVSDWNDEIHATSEGFARVADRFRRVLAQAGVT